MNHSNEFANHFNDDALDQVEKNLIGISLSQLMQESSENSENQMTESAKEHLEKLHYIIKSSVLKIKIKIRKLSIQFLKTKRINTDKVSRTNAEKMVEIFQKASNKVIEAFYVIASNEQFLQFESQNSMKEKLNLMKRQVNRSFLESMKRVTKKKDEFQVEDGEKVQQKKHVKAKNCKIPASSTVVLQKWLVDNFYLPYPIQKERQTLANQSNMSLLQVNNWFINKREKIIRKYLKKERSAIQDFNDKHSEISQQGSEQSAYDEQKGSNE